MRIVINAVTAKKNAGGAFQISYNFILESLSHPEVEWYWWVSSDIDEEIGSRFHEMRGTRYFAFPNQPDFKHSYLKVRKQLVTLEKEICPDVIYSITAPSFFSFSSIEVMRYTKPWVTHPNKYVEFLMTRKKRMEIALQKYLMKKARYFITQSQTCKDGIVRITGVDSSHVKVISNVLPAAYRNVERGHLASDDKWINVACIGNPFPHKDFDILPDVIKELSSCGICSVRFHVTIPKETDVWHRIESKIAEYGVPNNVVNYGRCSQKDLIKVYRKCHLCFLPTLLEVFSASAIEAMYFKLPTVATEFSFNSEVFEDACLYFHPHDAKDGADKLVMLINNKELQEELKRKMESRLARFSDYDNHFKETKEFLSQVALKKI